MSSLDLILRARAATYIGCSLTTLTEAEYSTYRLEVIDYNYPSFKEWRKVYISGVTPKSVRNKLSRGALGESFLNTKLGNDYYEYMLQKTGGVYTHVLNMVYSYRALQKYQAESPNYGISNYEWWLATPTGPKSCSRDIGDLRTRLRELMPDYEIGKGDEWDIDIEAAVCLYQATLAPYIKVPTGYADAETLRRLRMVI